MHIRRNDPGVAPDKTVIPREKLNDEELDRIVAETTAQLLKTEHYLNNLGAAHPETSTASDKEAHHPESLAQPKRPMNAFMVWGQCIRRELHNRYTNVQNAMLSKALGRVWKRLNLEEKKPYVDRASIIKANHKRDYPNYRYQPRRIQERRARQLKDCAKFSSEFYHSSTTGTRVHLNTEYPERDLVASYSGTLANNCVNHLDASTSQRSYAIQEPYLTSGGNNESIDITRAHQHEMPHGCQPQQAAAAYYEQAREVPIIAHGSDSIEDQQATQYVTYNHQTIIIDGENNFIYSQTSDKYSSSEDTLDRDKVGLQDQQPHQYYPPPVHNDAMYYCGP